MSSSNQPSERSRLDEYLDGTMPAQDREVFAREIAANPQLQAEVELQNRINQSLSQYYLPPTAPANLAEIIKNSIPTETTSTTSAGLKNLPYLNVGLAAAAVIGIWGGLFWYLFKPAPTVPETPRIVELVTKYRDAASTGYKPATAPTNPQEFTLLVRKALGKGLRIKSLPPGCKVVGFEPNSCAQSPVSIAIYVRIDEKPVMVFANPTASDHVPGQPPAESKLKLFRKEMGPLVLYELTPYDQARATELFELSE